MCMDQMKVRDYEFIYNIDALFEKNVVIYGAGIDGRRMYELLRAIPVDVECFCDKQPFEQPYLPIPVIAIKELKERIPKRNNYFVIIGSSDYCDEIISDLEQMQIRPSYLCTWHAVRIGLELHIEDKRFSEIFKKDFIHRKIVWNQNYALYYDLINRMDWSVYPNSILIYQIGKVGSTTVYQALKHANISTIHVHHLMKQTGISQIDDSTAYLVEKCRKDGVKIISLVREPIARALSEYMQGFCRKEYLDDRCESFDIETEARRWVIKSLEQNDEFEWFDREIKELTGVDVYEHAFDRERGYAWIKEGNTEILLLKLEKLDDNIDKIGEFVGKPGIKIVSENLGKDKGSKYIYRGLQQNFNLPENIVKQQYENNIKLNHFYTQEERKAFLKKWSMQNL